MMKKKILFTSAMFMALSFVWMTPQRVNAAQKFVIKDGVLKSYCGKEKTVRIPSSVKKIGEDCFANNQALEKVYVPKEVTYISKYAFEKCESLYMIKLEGKKTTFDKMAFYRCTKLVGITGKIGATSRTTAQYIGLEFTIKESASLVQENKTLLAGDVFKPQVLNTREKLTIDSKDSQVVKVIGSNRIKAVAVGKTKITITCGKKKYVQYINVVNRTQNNRLNQVIKEQIKDDKMSDFRKIKLIHNWIIRNVQYDYSGFLKGNVKQSMHTAKGPLLQGMGVCDGYAQTFEKFMDKLHIRCNSIIGRIDNIGHVWNQVRIKGKWYHIDVTYDDPIVNQSNLNRYPYYKYFLIDDTTISIDHKWIKNLYPKCKEKY